VSNYDATKTTTFFKARHYEDDTDTDFTYEPAFDLAQSTSYQTFTESGVRNGDDDSLKWLFSYYLIQVLLLMLNILWQVVIMLDQESIQFNIIWQDIVILLLLLMQFNFKWLLAT
jgi:hypothetical protein